MKNKLKFFKLIAFAAMIGISTVAYSDDDDRIIVNNTNGSLTISGFPSTYYGKWVYAVYDYFTAASNITSDGTGTLGQISNSGSVTLKVWKIEWDESARKNTFNNYNGSNTLYFFVIISDTSTFSQSVDFSELLAYGEITATFSNGTGSGKIGTINVVDY